MFNFEKFHEISVDLLVHKIPDLIPDCSVFFDILQAEHFFFLKLIQIFVYYWTFNSISLSFIFILVVIIFNMLTFLIVVIIEIPHSVGILAFFIAINTQPSQIESTKRHFFGLLGLFRLLFHVYKICKSIL